jgi:RNA polymerase primary sigma factor
MKNQRKRGKKQDNNLVLYFREINKIPMLSHEEEKITARAAAAGDKAAREKLVNANLRFVVNVAKKYQGLGLPLEDLINEGNIGLLMAVDRFDVDKGYHFITYAVWWIRQNILNALCEKTRMIRLPLNRAAELNKIKKARRLIKKQYSYEGEISEVAEFLNMDKNHISSLIDISKEILSLDKPVTEDKSVQLQDFIEDDRYNSEKDAEHKFMEADIEIALDTLEKDEADIIRRHYGLGCRAMSLQEISAHYSLSKERIRQIEERALARLRSPFHAGILEAYVA